MAWLVLILSGVLEAVWAVALDKSAGFTRLTPSIVFGVAIVLSFAGLAWSLKTLPLGTVYAVWVGVGAVLTVVYSFATGTESMTATKVLFLLMIIGGVVGLKLAH